MGVRENLPPDDGYEEGPGKLSDGRASKAGDEKSLEHGWQQRLIEDPSGLAGNHKAMCNIPPYLSTSFREKTTRDQRRLRMRRAGAHLSAILIAQLLNEILSFSSCGSPKNSRTRRVSSSGSSGEMSAETSR